jgi:hypothetical protein
MRPLAPSEKTLLLIFCGALFIALNLFGLRAFLQERNAVRLSMESARTELASDKSWVDLAESLQPAVAWINAHPLAQSAPDDASADLLKEERDEAAKAGLKVTEENLLPPQNTPLGSTVAVDAKFSGPFEGIVRMLFALQTPTAWRSVDKLTLQSDTQPPNVIANLVLRQYFRSSTPIPSSSPPAAP